MIKHTDIVLDLVYGDCGKQKVTQHLLLKNTYDFVIKISGGGNSGNTLYIDNVKFVSHLLPAGIFYNIKSVIGKNCLVNPAFFLKEIDRLQSEFSNVESLKHIDIRSLVKIDKNAFIIENHHIEEDQKDTKIGTTRSGIGPSARDKYARISRQAKDVPELKSFIIDFYEEIKKKDVSILCEGSQGFYLDIHQGDYPYVTSTHCNIAAAFLCDIPHTSIRDVYGVAKSYDTYVGAKDFQPTGEIFDKIADEGQEYGNTTGRRRKVNFLNLTFLEKAAAINGCNKIIINKMDVLQKLNCWKVIADNEIFDFEKEESFKNVIRSTIPSAKIIFSYSPYEV